MSRGVLELEADEPRWLKAVQPHAGELAARVAAAEPGLEIRRWRLRLAGDSGPVEAMPLPEVAEQAPAPRPPRRPSRAGERTAGAAVDLEPRLTRLAQRYLERSTDQKT